MSIKDVVKNIMVSSADLLTTVSSDTVIINRDSNNQLKTFNGVVPFFW